MSDLNDQFQKALEDVKTLSQKPNDDTLLSLYALYKQANEGDVTGERPGFFDFAGGAKFDARQELTGTSKEEAMQKYIDLVKSLLA